MDSQRRELARHTFVDVKNTRRMRFSPAGVAPIELEGATTNDARVFDWEVESDFWRPSQILEKESETPGWPVGSMDANQPSLVVKIRGAAVVHDAYTLRLRWEKLPRGGPQRFRVEVAALPVDVFPDRIQRTLDTAGPARTNEQWRELGAYLQRVGRVRQDHLSDLEWLRQEIDQRVAEEVLAGQFDAAARWCLERADLDRRSQPANAPISLWRSAVGHVAAGDFAAAEKQLAKLIDDADQLDSRHQWCVKAGRSMRRVLNSLSSQPQRDAYQTAVQSWWSAELRVQRQPAKAAELAQAALKILRGGVVIDEHGQAVAQSLLAKALVALGDIEEASVLQQSAMSYLTSVLSPTTADAQRLLAEISFRKQLVSAAFNYQNVAVEDLVELYGQEHPETAAAHVELARICLRTRMTKIGQSHCEKAISFYESDLKQYRLEAVRARCLLGRLHQSIWESEQAIVASETALEHLREMPDPPGDLVSQIYLTVGSAFHTLGAVSEAAEDWETALRVISRHGGPGNHEIRACLSLGLHYRKIGQYSQSEYYLARAAAGLAEFSDKQMEAEVYLGWGELHSARAAATADPEQSIKWLRSAVAKMDRALRLHRELNPNSPRVSTCQTKLAAFRLRLPEADLEALEQMVREAMRSRLGRDSLGTDLPNYSEHRLTLAEILVRRGKLEQARQPLQEVWEYTQHDFTETGPVPSIVIRRLAQIYSIADIREQQRAFARRSVDSRIEESARQFRGLSDREALAFQQSTISYYDHWLDTLRLQPNHEDATLAYNYLWRCHGMVVREQAARHFRSIHRPELQGFLSELKRTRRELSKTVYHAEAANWPEELRSHVQALMQRKETLQKRIALTPARSHGTSDSMWADSEPKPIRPADLLDQLPAGAVLIQFHRSTTEDVYDAFVVSPESSELGFRARWITLKNANKIDRLITQYRHRIADSAPSRGLSRDRDPQAADQDVAETLSEVLWRPIEAAIESDGQYDTIAIIPDGALWRVPWSALHLADGRYLIEKYAAVIATHGAELHESLSRPKHANRDVTLLGHLDYGDGDAPKWQPLPETQKEIESINEIWKDTGRKVTLLNGRVANKEQLIEQFTQSEMIHLATHGFLADNRFRTRVAGFKSRGTSVATAPLDFDEAEIHNPLLQSRLVLSGANQTGGAENSFLTAEEIIDTDMSGVDLVVLSCCESGLGKIYAGEGVFGLQRAFLCAGARTVVASIWQVGDRSTRRLMTRYHENLRSGKFTKIEALRQAQLTMLRNEFGEFPGEVPIYSWAGWSLSGHWR
ncbi:MAG: CHAT domain-containing protein [Pirellulales bacterium]|nr:CHAT domain-containing protein [Pirellulales bacterium]